MLKEILEEDSTKTNDEDVQKIWDKFDKEYRKFTKDLKKAGVGLLYISELDDLEFGMYDLLGVK